MNSDERKTGDVVHTYYNGGPVSIDEIEENLYLGNLTVATDYITLNKFKINHVLTIDTCQLPRNVLDLQHITFKFIQLSDMPKEDLLQHFDDTYEFITEGLKNGGVVFVHCYFGVSRSATVIIAYLMRKYSLTYKEAFEKAKQKRSLVFPNHGFVTQLKLYNDMNYTIDKNNVKYKIFRLNLAADKVKKARILPQDYFDLVKPDPGLTCTQPVPNVYRCKKCRRVLASESNLITHKDLTDPDKTCTRVYFLEPIWWMAGITQNTQGKLHCPKCNNKVGSFSWVMGCECHCKYKVAPAFYLCPSKVDWTNVVKNVECTI